MPAASDDSSEMVTLGRIIGAHGVKGWLSIFSYTDPKENIFSYRPWRLQDENGYRIGEATEYRTQGKKLIASLVDCTTRDDAEALVGAEILVPGSMLQALDEGDYYWRDLIGLAVVNLKGSCLGRIVELLETGANDVMIVRPRAGEDKTADRLIPWRMGEVIQTIDLAGQRIVVDWQVDW